MTSAVAADFGTIFRTLPARRRRDLFLVSLLIPLTAAAEMVTVAAVVPILAMLAGTSSNLPKFQALLDWIGRISPGPPLAAAALLFVVASLATALLRLLLSWKTLQFSARIGHDLNLAIQNRLLHQPLLFHVSSSSSRQLASLDKVDFLALELAQRGLQGIGATIISVAVIAVLLSVDPFSAAAAATLVLLLYGLVSLLFRRRLDARTGFTSRAYERRIQLIQESHGGIRDIIIDRSQSTHLAAFAAVDDPFMRARAEAMFLSGAPRYIVEWLGFCVIALLGLLLAARPGGLMAALPVLGALTLGAQRLIPLSSQIYNGWIGFTSSRSYLHDVAAILRLPIDQTNGDSIEIAFNKSIRFQNVGFRYSDRVSAALSGLNFAIPNGVRTAIVGKTGAGKSTLADLLMGLIEPTEGQICVDETPLDGENLAAWRRSIAHVPQSIFLADATIAKNIALAGPDELDMGRVMRAATLAQLDRFVSSLRDGFETLVGERGAKLSGGQRQRLGLARAIYRQAPLLVLDEATSALDDETEAAVLCSLDRLQADGCTIVIIAHRLSTVKRCDLVLMLDEGELVKAGSAAELIGPLERQGPI